MNLFERYDLILDALATAARLRYGDRLVSLAVYGSVGRGTQREDSDLDILLVVDGLPNGRRSRVDEFLAIEEAVMPRAHELGWRDGELFISPIIKTPAEVIHGSPILLDMVEDARILFDREGFFAERLERLRQRMRELGSKRVQNASARYWVLKPDLRPGEVFEL
jgi:hypothetical protein